MPHRGIETSAKDADTRNRNEGAQEKSQTVQRAETRTIKDSRDERNNKAQMSECTLVIRSNAALLTTSRASSARFARRAIASRLS